jgi:hypothetical protein
MSSFAWACASPSSAEKEFVSLVSTSRECGGPGLGARLWEPCSILGSFEQMFLLDPELSILAIRISPTDQFSCDLAVNLLDLELAVEPHCSPVHLLATPPASLLSTHRDLRRSRI